MVGISFFEIWDVSLQPKQLLSQCFRLVSDKNRLRFGSSAAVQFCCIATRLWYFILTVHCVVGNYVKHSLLCACIFALLRLE